MTVDTHVLMAEGKGQLSERRYREAEREHLEEVLLVEPDRLGDELADRPLLRRERRRQRLLHARLTAALACHQTRRLVANEWVRYTGRTRPTARKVATPHALAWRLPRL